MLKLSSVLLPQALNPPSSEELAKLNIRELAARVGLVRYSDEPSGFFDTLPLGTRLLKKVESHLAGEVADLGHQEMTFAPVQLRELMERSGRWDQFGQDVYELSGHGRPVIFQPAHEEYFTQLCKRLGVRSTKQLPVAMFTIDIVASSSARPNCPNALDLSNTGSSTPTILRTADSSSSGGRSR